MSNMHPVNRRTFLKTSAALGGGLALGAYLPGLRASARTASAAGALEPNVWIRIGADDSVRVMLTMLEMGQGVMTSMPQAASMSLMGG